MGILLLTSNTNLLYSTLINQRAKFENLIESPRIAEEGEKLNVILHQSYYNNTPIEFLNLSDSYRFNVPCPTEQTFNSSYTEFLINNIYAPNKTLDVETTVIGFLPIDTWCFTSFRVLDDCILKTVKVNIRSTAEGRIFYYDVYTSKFENGYITPDQDINGGMYFLGEIYNDSTTNIWLNLTELHQELDIDTTYNNTFFIYLWVSGTGTRWYYETESNGIDDTISWYNNPYPESGLDYTLIVEVAPLNNNPSPSQIELKINDSSVIDNLDDSGYWISNEEYSDPSGQLEFELSAHWWDVSCDINSVQMNYTKTDLKANTNFYTPETNLFLWNASIDESIDSFDSRIDDYNYIAIWVPELWTDIKAFNGSVEKPIFFSKSEVIFYQRVNIHQAGNGYNWYLTAVLDSRLPGIGTISFGNYFLLFTTIGVISLIYFKKKLYKIKIQL